MAEGRSVPIQQLVASTIRLIKDTPTTKKTVLDFYGELFHEYTSFYLSSFYDNRGESLGKYLTQFKSSSRVGHFDRKRLSSDRRISLNDPSTSAVDDSTPASPTPAVVAEVSEEGDGSDDLSFIEELMEQVSTSLSNISTQISLTDWSLDLICSLSYKFSDVRFQLMKSAAASNSEVKEDLASTISFWQKCKATSLLLQIIVKSIEEKKLGYEEVLSRLTNFTPLEAEDNNDPKTDWICCYILTSIPLDEEGVTSFSNCIEFLMKSSKSNITSILSYLSYHNPRAIINSSRNNVSFLLELCRNSKPLLDLLSMEAVSSPIVNLLNEIAPTLSDEQITDQVLFCILNASNSYELLSLAFEISMNPRSSKLVRSRAILVLTAVTSHIHEQVYCKTAKTFPILEQLKCNVDQLIIHPTLKYSASLSKIQHRLLTLLSVHFGFDFMTRIVFQMMNNLKPDIASLNRSSLSIINSHPVISSFLFSLRPTFGEEINHVFNKVMRIDEKRKNVFWYNLISFLDSEYSHFDLDIDLLTEYLLDYIFDDGRYSEFLDEDLERLHLVLKLIYIVSEKYPKQVAKPKHNLSLTMVVNYVNLVNAIEKEKIGDGENMDKAMLIINLSQKIMSNLSSKYSTNQHILSRSFIDCIITNDKNEESCDNELLLSDASLKNGNLRYAGPQASHKFRKIPLESIQETHVAPRERRKSSASFRNYKTITP